jgi:polar amino acid transport system ATP-binding protein
MTLSTSPTADTDIPVLQARGLTKKFHGHAVVEDVSLKVLKGETICVLGPSGAGKSTFLRCMNLLEEADSGLTYLNGEVLGYEKHKDGLRSLAPSKLAVQRARIGMVFQQFNLFPNMTAIQNVMIGPMKVLGLSASEARERADKLLKSVGMSAKGESRPPQLSGGQQQRIAIARALAMDPDVILFDEPTSALDPEMVGEVLEVMRGLADRGTTMVVVTHEVGFAREAADWFLFMEAGKAVESGPIDVLNRGGENTRTQAFLSSVL